MSASLTPSPKMQFFDANGDPLVGGKLYTYAAGTTTPLATYTDSTGGTPNANPVVMNARGEASVWLGTSAYYFELKDSTDSLIWTADNITGQITSSQVQSGSYQWLTSVSGADAITATASIIPSSYAAGQTFRFVSAGANTGAVTLNISGLGAKAITKNGTTALAAGDIPSGAVVEVTYDGTRFQLINVKVSLTGLAASGANSDITSLSALTGINGSSLAGLKNVIINGGFTINQRAYVSGATLGAGTYGHDRWKAGASGGDYSFTQGASNTTITIASGKTLIQVIEDKNVHATQYVLSWTGTAQARYSVNSATPAGAYAASPITITGQNVGTVMSVEFNTGTLGKVQLEATTGSIASAFEQRPYGIEERLAQRYYYRVTAPATDYLAPSVFINSPTVGTGTISFPVPMRTAPTALEQTGSATDYRINSGGAITVCSAVPTFDHATQTMATFNLTVAAGLTTGHAGACMAGVATPGYLGWSAEL